METGGAPAATEPWWRYVAGDDSWTKLEPALRERMRASAHTLFEIELGTYERYLPDDETLAAIAPRVRLLISTEGLPAYAEVARQLGERLGVNIHYTPGTHAAYHDHPYELAERIRPLLRELSATSPSSAHETALSQWTKSRSGAARWPSYRPSALRDKRKIGASAPTCAVCAVRPKRRSSAGWLS